MRLWSVKMFYWRLFFQLLGHNNTKRRGSCPKCWWQWLFCFSSGSSLCEVKLGVNVGTEFRPAEQDECCSFDYFLCLQCTWTKWKCGSWDFICFNRDFLPFDEIMMLMVFLVHLRYITMQILINRSFCVRYYPEKMEGFLVDTFNRLGFACWCLQWVLIENPVHWTGNSYVCQQTTCMLSAVVL